MHFFNFVCFLWHNLSNFYLLYNQDIHYVYLWTCIHREYLKFRSPHLLMRSFYLQKFQCFPQHLPHSICPTAFAPQHLPHSICPTAFAPQHLPHSICPTAFAPQHLPHSICPTAFAPQHLPHSICPTAFAPQHLPHSIC